jgi:hypothetical protein
VVRVDPIATEVEFEGSVGSGAARTDDTSKAAAAEARREVEGKIIASERVKECGGRGREGRGTEGKTSLRLRTAR